MHFALSVLLGFTIFISSGISNAQTAIASKAQAKEKMALGFAITVLQEYFVEDIPPSRLKADSVASLMREVDPDAGFYFSPEDVESMKRQQKVGQASIGANIMRRSGELIVVPYGNSPTTYAGLKLGDQLQKLNGQSTSQMGVFEANLLLYGEEGTPLEFVVKRAGIAEAITVKLERSVPSRQSVVSELAGNTLILRMPRLIHDDLFKETANLVGREWQDRPFKQVILDLRGCSGGTLSAVTGMASIFLAKNTLVAKTVGSSARTSMEFRVRPDDYARLLGKDPLERLPVDLKKLPLAVLVDESTSSGAELIAAALSDNERAILVGRTTMGLGNVDTYRPILGGGAIRFTSAYMFSPKGKKIHGAGVAPDIAILDADNAVMEEIAIRRLEEQGGRP